MSSTDDVTKTLTGRDTGGKAAKTVKVQSKAAQKQAKVSAQAARKVTKEEGKAVADAAKEQRKTAGADSRHRRHETTLSRKASKAAAKASKAAVKANEAAATAASTKPARVIDKVTDPKTAKRAVTLGKILAPALIPVVVKAAASTRGFLDEQRARRLGVPMEQVAAYRGRTGVVGARIDGLNDSLRELASRTTKDLQVTRFIEVSETRLRDLTAAVQAAASMPRLRRREVLHAVGRELDGIEADLVAHLMSPSRA